jgi:palmitoyltransferase
VQTWLDKNPDLDISSICDLKKYSLLHFAAFNNQLAGVILMVSHLQGYVRRMGQDPERIKESTRAWINRQTEDGFTAMHFASYRGNIKMIEYLQQMGADIFTRNRHGMNVLHIAAQGD